VLFRSKLQTKNILAVISSSDSQDIRLITEHLHLSGYFEDVLGSDAHLSKKEKIIHALGKYGTTRGRTYYIGDTTGDIKEAKTAGIKTVGVTWGWHTREKLAAANPDYLMDTPEELLDL